MPNDSLNITIESAVENFSQRVADGTADVEVKCGVNPDLPSFVSVVPAMQPGRCWIAWHDMYIETHGRNSIPLEGLSKFLRVAQCPEPVHEISFSRGYRRHENPFLEQPPHNTKTSGHVYFMRAGDLPFIKIGFSRDVNGRRNFLQPGCPVALNVLATTPGSLTTEKRLHEQFDHIRERGEWFHLTPELEDFINEVRDAQ